jgi:hypothetical protein
MPESMSGLGMANGASPSMSWPVTTASTPAAARASVTSMLRMPACAMWEVT